MALIRHSVASATLEARVRARLSGPARAAAVVAWGERDEALILHLTSLAVRVRSGWVMCNLDVTSPGTPRTTLQIFYFVGRDGDGDGTAASAAVHAPGAGAAIADQWGLQLQRTIWDGVLDALEAVVALVGRLNPGRALDLVGFTGSDGGLDVDVEVKAAA